MVEWAVNNTQPQILCDSDAPFHDLWPQVSSNVIRNPSAQQGQRERVFQILFPCKTGTFTSFANHTSKFGYIVLTKYESVKNKLLQWIKDGKKPIDKNDIIAVGDGALDCRIARIIFILDIFDDLQQIIDVCQILAELKIPASISEYMCRPVSATIARKEGDCVETLYRHLINIAIQDDKNLNLFHIERLPKLLRKCFGPNAPEIPKEIRDRSYSGSTSIKDHDKWKNALQSVSDFKTYFNTSSGAVYNIARTLWQIGFFETTEQMKPFVELENFGQTIATSMNKLTNSSNRFTITISDAETATGWITKIISIQDTTARRTITIGVCEDISNDNFGHAEIISITPIDKP